MRKIEAKSENQQKYIDSMLKNKVTLCDGPAGSGKTIISTLHGLYGVLANTYDKLIISRPLVQSDYDSGFLPGTLDDKLAPYIRPVMDIIEQALKKEDIDKLIRTKKIEIIPFGYMRGLTFYNSFVIFDEAQNCTLEQLILGLTRLGKNSKLVISGDSKQSDLPISKQGGISYLMGVLGDIKEVGNIHLDNEDIVREPIIKKILTRLDEEKARQESFVS